MKKLPAILFLTAALWLCGCSPDTDNNIQDTEQTDVLETAVSDIEEIVQTEMTEPVLSETALQEFDSDVVQYDGQVLDSVKIAYNKVVQLVFTGAYSFDYGEYNGTLELVCYTLVNGTKGSELGRCTIYDNKSFWLRSPVSGSEYGLTTINSEIISFQNNMTSGVTAVRLFELERNGEIKPFTIAEDENYSDIILNEYEFAAANFRWSVNSYTFPGEGYSSDDLNSIVHNCYDFGSRRYVEYDVDCETNMITIAGSFDYKSDADISYAVEKADIRQKFAYGFAYSTYLDDYMTKIGEDQDRGEEYFQVDPAIVSDRDELMSFIRSGFSERYASIYFRDLEEEMFGGDYPVFTENEDGLVYIYCYRGVPHSYDFDTVRVLEQDGDSAAAIVCGHSLDQSVYEIAHLVKENGIWVVDDYESGVLGCYFDEQTASWQLY